MKKSKKILLVLATILVSGLIMGRVKATALPVITYQTYINGTDIVCYDSKNSKGCDLGDESFNDTYKFKVTNDAGNTDELVTLTNVSNSSTVIDNVKKGVIAGGYVIHATSPVTIYLKGEDGYKENPSDLSSSITSIEYFKATTNDDFLPNLIAGLSKNDSIMINETMPGAADSIVVPAGVNVSALMFNINTDPNCALTVNGTFRTGMVSAYKINGSGKIDLVYDTDLGIDPNEFPTAIINSLRFAPLSGDVSGVTINIVSKSADLDGLGFGVEVVSNEALTTMITSLNKLKGTSLNDYKVIGKTYPYVNSSGETINYYYGELVRTTPKTTVKITTKKLTNPKTSDAIMIIGSLAGLVLIGSFMTLRKIKKAN